VISYNLSSSSISKTICFIASLAIGKHIVYNKNSESNEIFSSMWVDEIYLFYATSGKKL
jgi:hypothetical protein